MRGLRYAWAMGVLALCGIMAAAGRAEVTKTGDVYDDGSSVYAGYNENTTGALQVDAGSVLSRSDGVLGYSPGSMGTAIVAGAGSKWTNSGGLWIGRDGSGTLTVSDGGLVSANALFASLSDLYGNGTIAASSAVLDGELVFDATHGAEQTVAFGSGGVLQFPTDGSGTLGVGYRRSGSLRIAEGRSVTSAYGSLGHNSGSTGTATIAGAGSTWINAYELRVGEYGSGTLRIEAGGQVSGGGGFLGYYSGSSGEAVVTGAGSTWNPGSLLVGHQGSGKLTVSDGGLVSCQTLYASLSDLRGNGMITVQGGAVLDADLVFDAAHDLTQTLAFGSGGTLQLTVDDSSVLGIGYNRSGSLRITEGRSVASTYGYLGYNAGSTGTATISGVGSKWSNSYGLLVGMSGSGSLRVEAGAEVRSGYAYLGSDRGTTGTATIVGVGSKWTNSGEARIGYYSSGTLRVEAGAQVSSDIGYLGYSTGSTGTATITGAGSKWTNTVNLCVGYNGRGTLRIEDVGQVSNSSGYLGFYSGSAGTATITGARSKWTNSSYLYVGHSGTGTLRIEDGGQVSSSSGYLGYYPSSMGEAVVTGAESKWTNGTFCIGNNGSGTLRVQAGGQVISNAGTLGYHTSGSGAATITGAGSKWTNSGILSVGYTGRGSLIVSDGGQVAATSLSINSPSTVRLHISGDRMLVLGDASTKGSVSSSGKLSLLADAFLAAGTYRPIGEYADRALSWDGAGTTLSVGGTWDRNAGTFTVVAPTLVEAGTAAAVGSGRRLVISDLDSGERVGVSFGTLSSGTTLRAMPITESERAGLKTLLGSEETIAGGWDFVGQLAGGEALVSFDIGLGAENLRVWRLWPDGWSEYTPEMMTYDAKGIVSFTVNPASLNSGGYAVSVPEPGVVGVLAAVVGIGLVRRRRGNGE